MSYLPCVEIEPASPADSVIIWLHGLGADGHDFAPLVPQLILPEGVHTRFVFPHAPSRPVTINGGHVMPAWYDILALTLDREVDSIQLLDSASRIARLIDRELQRGIDSRRVLVAGFSQGGAVAYQTALNYPSPLGGLLVLSSYFATADRLEASEANRQIPILIQHGVQDPVVPEVLGRNAARILTDRGYTVDYQQYAMEHSVCPQQVLAISDWFGQVLVKPGLEKNP